MRWTLSSPDPYIGLGAQLCLDYIIYAQHLETGGWRYRAKEAGRDCCRTEVLAR